MIDKELRSFKYFELELKSLASYLIITNPYFTGLPKENIWEKEPFKDEKERIERELNFEPTTKEFIVRSFEKNIGFLSRELLYIRVISALEIFLTQAVRDVFKQTTIPFRSNEKRIELNHSQILELTTIRELRNMLLHKETRPLSSAGYEDVVKFYKRQLGIDISSFQPGLQKMKYYHDVRHILVHRLGKTDGLFRERYGFTKTYLQIDEELLINLFNDVYVYTHSVADSIKSLIDTHTTINVYREFKGSRYRIEFDSKIMDKVNFLESDFHFWVGDEIFYLQDLGLNVISKGPRYVVEIWGKDEILKSYRLRIKAILKTSKYFENIVMKPIKHPKVFDESIILAVSKLLPSGLWPLDIRKKIASELGISNNNVDRIIKILNDRGMHLKPEE